MVAKEDRILLTGGTGFLGSHILNALLSNGYKNIVVLSRSVIQSDHEHVRYVQSDILDVFKLDEILENIDCVIHAAAIVSFQKKHRREMFAVNVEGTSNLVNLALDHKIKNFIHISSTAAIGKNLDDSMISEKTKWSNKLPHTQYALSKYMAEKQVWRGYAEGLPVYIINPSLILGKGDWNSGTSGFFSRIAAGLSYYPTGSNGLVSAEDISRFVCLLLEQNAFGERYIVSAINMSYKELFGQIAKGLSQEIPHRAIEGRYKTLARLKEFFSRITGNGSRYLTPESLENISEHKSYSNAKSIAHFDFQYQNIAELIEDLSQSYLQQVNA